MLRHYVSKHAVAFVFLATLIFASNDGMAQSAASGFASPLQQVQRALAISPRTAPSADVSGHWTGNLGSSPTDPAGVDWVEEIEFHQNTDGTITGTRRTIPLQNTANWASWSISGSLSGTTLTFQDQSLLGQGDASHTPCATTITSQLSADGKGFVGTWSSNQSGCAGGAISATKDAVDPAKNLGDGARCDAGEGTAGGSGNSSSGAAVNSTGPSCPSISGSPYQGDPINSSTGNNYLQEDDYTATSWLTLRRFYNSDHATEPASIGTQWRHSFDRNLQIFGNPASTIVMVRPDGKQETFTKSNGAWSTELNADQLTETDNAQGVPMGYNVFIGATRRMETYDTLGRLLAVTSEDGQGITLTYSTSSTPSSIAPRVGLLLTVTDPQGRQLNFTYTYDAKVHKVTLPDGGALGYSYNLTSGNLTAVQYPDAKTRQYVYNESSLTSGTNLPNALTGVIDENGDRYESTTYDNTGRATSSSFAGGVGATQIAYSTDGSSAVTYPLGQTINFGFTTADGLVRVGTLDQPCGLACAQPWKARTYDAYGFPATYTDFNNVATQVTYDSYGLLHQQVEALGQTTQRTVTTSWDTVLRNPLKRSVSNASGAVIAITAWVYNSRGQPLARCEIDPTVSVAASYTCSASGVVPTGVRRSTYTYCDAVGSNCPLVGLMLTATGPRIDLTQTTTYSYYTSSNATNCGTPGATCYQAGDLYQIKDALDHVTTIASYDGAGRVTRITDHNGVNVDMTYTPRGWLASWSVDGATTSFAYTSFGAVATVTDPDNVTTKYAYDTAHRLKQITDALGNYVVYALDAAGNKTAEKAYTAYGTVTRSLSRQFNTLGQLTTVVDGLNQTVFNASVGGSYDANGNLVLSTDALGFQRKLGYDALNRLVSTLDNFNGSDAATKDTQTTFAQDVLDRLEGVDDPSGLDTSYDYDGLGNLTAVHSPDTGTSTDTYDAAGNRLAHTDAKGIFSTSTYDALNRRVGVSYTDSTLNVGYYYDEADTVTGCSGSHPIGRLTRIVEYAVSTIYCYDARGNLTRKSQTQGTDTDTTHYTYTPAGRLSGQVNPSGVVIQYGRDADGRISTISLQTDPFHTDAAVSMVSYLPFGPIASYTLGNGQKVTRSYNANYQLTDVTSPALALHFARDAAGNITAMGNTPGASPATETYLYDPLYRLTSVTGAGGTTLESYTYNRTGDRLSKTASSPGTGSYSYASGSHRLIGIGNAVRTNDANGNTTASAIGGETYGFGYNSRNRMTIAQRNGATVGTYTYNTLGQRIAKTATFPQAISQRYTYDESGHLMGEYADTSRDYLWLDDLPVAVVDGALAGGLSLQWVTTVNYVHADGLGTPRAVTDSSGDVIWQWAYPSNPFGEKQPTSADGYVLNFRYSGQYYDAETGTNYNLFRTYEPATGRYLQSDPIGLPGGISTYAYVGGNPLSYTDPLGLESAQYSIGQIPDGRSYRTPCQDDALLKLEVNLTPPGAAIEFLKDITGAEVDFDNGIPSLSFGNYNGVDTSAAVGGYAADGIATGMYEGHIANMAQRAADSSINYQLRNAAMNRMRQSIAKSAALSGFGKALGPAAAFYTFYQDMKKCGCAK